MSALEGNSMIHRIKSKGLITEATIVVSELKACSMHIVEVMEENEYEGASDDIQDRLAEILGGLVVQTVALETALNEEVLKLEHKPLVDLASKTVKDINLHFRTNKSLSGATV